MISVAYEVTSLAVSPYGGIARACYHTLQLAGSHPGLSSLALYRHGHPDNLKETSVPSRRSTILSCISSPTYDIVHALCHRLPPVRSRKTIYTVHDVWSLETNEYQGESYQKKLAKRMKRDIARSDMIVTDSEWTRQRLVALGLAEAGTCHAVPLGVVIPPTVQPTELSEPVRQVLSLRYVLFVGRIENRKNLGHVVDAVRSVPNLSLVVVGEPGFGYDEIVARHFVRIPSDRLMRFARLSPSDLTALYHHAVGTLLPSWEEGFGMPVLEAMAAGSPVITSNRSACAEVAGDAATLVDSDAPAQSVAALTRLLEDEPYRSEMIEKGRERSQMFSWERYMQGLLTLYNRVLSTGGKS
ncbi:MAG: glycosyltransferase family 1 protein [Candidatus Zixiibacteriota bacterium]